MGVSKKIMTGLTALSLVAVPTLASAAPSASRLSLVGSTNVHRAGASTTDASQGRGGSGVIIGLGALALIILAAILASRGNNSPRSA